MSARSMVLPSLYPRLLVMLVAASALAIGCGPAAPPTGSVHGQVRFSDKPIADARIMFENGEMGSVAAVPLGADGTYRVEGLGLGEYVVTVLPPDTQISKEIGDFDGSKPAQQTKTASPKNIPAKFSATSSSPLRHTVVEGDTEFSVDLAK